MNLFTKKKQTHRHREQIYGHQRGKEGERDKLGVWGQQMQTITFRMDTQQGPTVEHRELYSISFDKP